METYGDLKKAIKSIQLKQKGEKVGKVTVDVILGAIPGLGAAKSTFDVLSAAFRKPDTKKSNSWLDKLDIDDEMEAIVDDTVENGFLKFLSKAFDSESDDKPLEQDFNMNAKMVDYLKKNYKQRTVTGISEQKSVFDKFFTKFAYKFDKGYPDMNNDQDVLLLESLISENTGKFFTFNILKEELFIFEATDREISTNTSKAIDYIIQNADSSLGFKKQSDKKRLGNPNKVDPEKVQQIFKDLVGVEGEITIHNPRSGPNPSGKFDMYEFDSEKFGPVRIVLSGGGNAGEKYEQEFVDKAKATAGDIKANLPADLKTLYAALGIDSEKLTADDISFAGATDTKRSLSLEGPKDIGKTISDLTIKYNGKEYYISLKNKAGSGIYSGKNVPFIYEKDGKVVYDASKKGSAPGIDLLFDIFNIDEEKLAQGLNNFKNQEGEVDNWSSVDIDKDKFKNLLASSLGYGYYYVREKGKGDVKVIPLLTAEDAVDAIGNIKNAQIKYPGPNTKQLTMKIDTDSPTFGASQYQVAVRNTQGGFLPLSLRISKTK